MNTLYNNARILIVDDDEDDFIITSGYISAIPGNSYQIDWGCSYSEGANMLKGGKYDLYFVDYRLGAKTGVDFLEEALSHKCEKPAVLLTGKGNFDVDMKAMQLGAVDYLVKTELSTEKMERCIRYALERSATLKALKANEKKYRNIFEKSKDIVFVADKELNFKELNEAVKQILGFEKEQLNGQNLCSLLSNKDDKDFFQNCINTGSEVNDREVILNTSQGEKRNCTVTLTLAEKNNKEVFVQGIIHDITNLRKAEKATLQTEKLAAAGRLVRTIAHEVRNPLNNITLSADQLRQDIKDENQQVYFDIISRNGKRISDLISELLHTSMPAENTLAIETLQKILDDVIATSVDRLNLKRIKLNLNYPNDKVEIFADRVKLKMALMNLITNAVEAMEEMEGKLSLSLEKAGNRAILTITDNGCGISEENISRLFEPYFSQKRNGVGLGLTFTLNILQSHGATIDVASTLGLGSAFTIFFPLAN